MSKIEVNTVEPQCGTTLTLGASGDTVTLGSGASQSGFGRTGTVDWQTTPKTANFTAANGEGYFVNTTSGAITMTMPSGSAGAIVSIQDYNKTFDTNALTVTPASGEKINGGPADGILPITTEGQGLTFVYVDSTVGWKTVHENDFTSGGTNEIVASGGTITTCGDYKIHTFTGPGTFCVSQISGTPANNTVSYLVVAGGGGGGTLYAGGGGGAGGFREYRAPVSGCYSVSPLNGAPAITVTATSYPITVGAGGAPGTQNPCNAVAQPTSRGSNGANSVFSTVTSAGGGGGGGGGNNPRTLNPGSAGGSGGGGMGNCSASSNPPGGNGNTPPVSPPQGNNGGSGSSSAPIYGSGAGGGATAVGGAGTSSAYGNGGAGASTSISGSSTAYAGGGGGGIVTPYPGPGGAASPCGTGGAGANSGPTDVAGANGTTNRGGGGGGGSYGNRHLGGTGGSGVVIIRYKFQ